MSDSILASNKESGVNLKLAEVVSDVAEATQTAAKLLEKSDSDQLKDIVGANQFGTEFVAARTGKKYYLRPAALDQIPKLVAQIKIIDQCLSTGGNPVELLTAEDNKVIKSMAEIIKIGTDGELSIQTIMKDFSLGDFPKVYKIVLDLNDFLSGMRTIYS
jgi:hypothetical protein